jgi:DUF971 family protein
MRRLAPASARRRSVAAPFASCASERERSGVHRHAVRAHVRAAGVGVLMTSYVPTVIRRSDPRRVEIEWNDGTRTLYSPAELRGLCPCAQCVNEISGKRMNDPGSVSPDLEQSELHMIGNYAISMRFSDGHHTGIYTFKYLRENDPAGGAGRTPPPKAARPGENASGPAPEPRASGDGSKAE